MSDSTAKKNSLVAWGSIEEPKARGSGSTFLKLESGKTANVRLFHLPKQLYRYYNPKNKNSALTDNPEGNPIAVKGYKDAEGKAIRPKKRFAIIVIDRADHKVKVMEAPLSVFLEFRKFNDNIGINPGGPEACDFAITVKGKGLQTEYSVQYKLSARTPFTAEEKAMLESRPDLEAIFKAVPDDEIEAKLGLVEGASEPTEEPAEPTGDASSDIPW